MSTKLQQFENFFIRFSMCCVYLLSQALRISWQYRNYCGRKVRLFSMENLYLLCILLICCGCFCSSTALIGLFPNLNQSFSASKQRNCAKKKHSKRMRINDSEMFSFQMKNSLVLSRSFDDTAAAQLQYNNWKKNDHFRFSRDLKLTAHCLCKRVSVYSMVFSHVSNESMPFYEWNSMLNKEQAINWSRKKHTATISHHSEVLIIIIMICDLFVPACNYTCEFKWITWWTQGKHTQTRI